MTRGSDRATTGIGRAVQHGNRFQKMLVSWMKKVNEGRKRQRIMLGAVTAATALLPAEASICVYRKRLDWNLRKQTLLWEGVFVQCYRMEVESFERLLLLIRFALLRSEM